MLKLEHQFPDLYSLGCFVRMFDLKRFNGDLERQIETLASFILMDMILSTMNNSWRSEMMTEIP